MKKLALAAVALLATTAIPAQAVIIKYTVTGNFSGTLNGVDFDDVAAVFSGYGDTATATTGGFGLPSYVAIQLTSFKAITSGDSQTFRILSQGTFGTYQASEIEPGNTQTRLGFIFDGNGSNGIALQSNAYNGYNGLTAFAQTAGNVYYQNASFNTDRGAVVIDGFTNGTFSAAVPEAATWAMMFAGFGAVGFASRRRRHSVRVTFA